MSKRKLLLADDSITIQKVVNLTFADEGIEVITVGDGDSAMEKMSEVAPDLVMADVNMPGLNGYQICERIRQSEELKRTPVILLVGSFEPFDEEEARRVGANDFLTKPFQSIRQLVSKVTDLLQGAAQNGEAPSAEELQNAETLSNFSPQTEDSIGSADPDAAAPAGEQYGDTGMDDEMIESSNASGFALDESAKFETREVDDFGGAEGAKTQPLSAEDLRRFSEAGYETGYEEQAQPSEEPAADDASGEKDLHEQQISHSEQTTEETSMAQTARALVLDEDDDLLEIPFDEEEEEWEEPEAPETSANAAEQLRQEASQAETAQETETAPAVSEAVAFEQSAPQQASIEEESAAFQPAAADAPAPAQLSAEMIDAIAQRVVEKLSDKAVKDVAWEVVPQMADLIIKKMTEEKLKE